MPAEQEPLASIDDLLAGPMTEEIPRALAPAPTPRAAPWLFWASVVSALAAAAVFVVTLAVGYKISYLLLFCSFFALVSLRRALTTLAAPRLVVGAEPKASAPTDADERADGLQLALTRWRKRMATSQREPDRFASAVRPRLAEIADERLRQRHGVTRVSDPRRAREIMGEQLWTFLISPLARTPNPRELASVVKDMEKI